MSGNRVATKMKAQHTDGPWFVKQPGEHGKKLRVVNDIGVEMSNGERVYGGIAEVLTKRTSTDGYSDATDQANAKLIAAAPDLLDALGVCVAALQNAPCGCSSGFTCHSHQAINAASSAISKATVTN